MGGGVAQINADYTVHHMFSVAVTWWDTDGLRLLGLTSRQMQGVCSELACSLTSSEFAAVNALYDTPTCHRDMCVLDV